MLETILANMKIHLNALKYELDTEGWHYESDREGHSIKRKNLKKVIADLEETIGCLERDWI